MYKLLYNGWIGVAMVRLNENSVTVESKGRMLQMELCAPILPASLHGRIDTIAIDTVV